MISRLVSSSMKDSMPLANDGYTVLEVAACVNNTNDPSIKCNSKWKVFPTILIAAKEISAVRAWVLTTVFVMLFSGVNQFFGLRYVSFTRSATVIVLHGTVPNADFSKPSLSIGYVVAQLLIFPIGRIWEKLPRWRVPLGSLTFDINPGPFTIKEHALTVIVRFQQLVPTSKLIIQ